MTVLERNVEKAVTSAEGLRYLRGYLQGLLDGGLPANELEDVLKGVYQHLRDTGQEQGADLVLDCLDLVTGWCGPGMALSV